jgi:alkylation response protein AidB-like acyl-CoA dehydrogenase
VFGTRAGERACWAAQQVLGGYGYMRDYPLEHRMRDAKVLAVLNGDGRRRIQAAVRAAEGGLAPWR